MTATPFARTRTVIGVVVVAIFAILFVRAQLILKPQAIQHHGSLEAAWRSIHHPDGAVLRDEHNSRRSAHVLVGGSFNAPFSYRDLRAHYDGALAAIGWRFRSERPLRDWGRDLGGQIATYCNGDEAATLQFAGERANYGWTYGLDFTWGSAECE